jgi:hypothetical protein
VRRIENGLDALEDTVMNGKTLATLIPTVAAVLALGAASSAVAQGPAFDDLDVDGDGYISSREAEALPCLAEAFDEIETESERGLNREEYARAVVEHCGN